MVEEDYYSDNIPRQNGNHFAVMTAAAQGSAAAAASAAARREAIKRLTIEQRLQRVKGLESRIKHAEVYLKKIEKDPQANKELAEALRNSIRKIQELQEELLPDL